MGGTPILLRSSPTPASIHCENLAGEIIRRPRREKDHRAFEIAREQSRRGVVIVESHVVGKDYRCLIIDGRMVAIAERVPAHVVGDGQSSVEQLVELTNADPRRGVGHEKVLTRIKIDAGAKEVLAGQGHTLESVPDNGEMDAGDMDQCLQHAV